MVITIDGPAASGKSTVAQIIAKKRGIFYLNTGLLYRALAYLVFYRHETLQDGLKTPPQVERGEVPSAEAVVPLIPSSNQVEPRSTCVGKVTEIQFSTITRAFLDGLPTLEYNYAKGQATVAVNGHDITSQSYATPGIDKHASQLSTVEVVREFMLDIFRGIAAKHDVIADGRDCGSVIFPQADYKFYLTASLDARAERRLNDPKVAALGLTFDQVRADLADRDERDKTRAVAPLVVPAGAIVIDATHQGIELIVESVEKKAFL